MALVFGEVRFGADVHAHHVTGHGAARGRGIRARVADDRLRFRRHHVRRKTLHAPALAKRKPFLVDVGQPPLVHPLHRPVRGTRVIGRAGHARPVDVAQPADVVHRLRARERLLLDAPDGPEINRRLRGCRDGEQAQKSRGADAEWLHTGLLLLCRRRHR